MTDAEKRLVVDLELLYDKWTREWVSHIRCDTHPTRETERIHLQEFKKFITEHVSVDIVTMDGYLK